MSFAYPAVLLLLLALPLLAWQQRRAGKRPAFLYSSTQLARSISSIQRPRAGMILNRLRWLALALLIIGLAQPRLDEGETTIRASGIDIVVAFDLSGSMVAEDFVIDGQHINRLEIARRVLHEFIEKRPTDRIGLVAFARNAYIAAPLTLDHAFLRQNLDRLTFATREEDGTAIGSAIVAAVNRLRDVESKSKIVILMTDGQNNAGQVPPLTAAEAAHALQIKVYTIGVGTRGDAPVPYIDAFGRQRYTRQPVDIDEETLRAIAARTGARYYRADDTETLRSIYAEIDQLERTDLELTQFQNYRELFSWLILPALALLLLRLILANTVWRTLP
jgi:Ca-activated chloride channel homolog